MTDTNYYELSNPQKRIWLTELVNNHVEMSNIAYLIELKGKYDPQKLAEAIKYVVKINDGLQLRFKYVNKDTGELNQFIPEYEEIEVELIEVTSEKELFDQIERKHRQRFEITDKSLCSFYVFSINNERFGFLEKAHHLVADGISATIVAREVIETYQRLEGKDIEEITKEHSYMDFVKAEAEYVDSEKYNRSKDYWMNRFEDYEGEEITFALNTNKKNSLKVKRRSFGVPGNIIESFREYEAANRLSHFHLFMAGLAVYFNRFMNHEDIVVGMPVHNRSQKIFRNMVGMFVSTLPFRIHFGDDWSFNDLIGYVKKNLWEALKHQSFPFNHMIKNLKDAGMDTESLLNVQLIELPGGAQEEVEKRWFFNQAYNISQLSIYLNQQNSKDLVELDVAIDYHGDIFEEREIEFFFKRLMTLLEQAINEPERKLSELSLLEDAETNELVNQLNNTQADFPRDKTLPQLFEEQVTKNPGNIALEYEGKTVTYKELGDVTDKLAARLQGEGIKPDSIVGMLCERSIEAMVCIMGVLKAGGAYVPIDPEYPLERKNYIISNSGITILLTEKALEQRETELMENNKDVTCMVIDYQTLVNETVDSPLNKSTITSDNLAYVIYTSGTTGNPKGTLLRHRNVINYITWGAKFYVDGNTMNFPLFTSLSFDLTVTSIFIPMITGNKLVIYRESEEGLLIEKVVKDNKVDIIKLTPSHLKVVNQLKLESSRIKSFIVGGEELRTEVAMETHKQFGGNINIYNEYGPTETAVGC
ncbi:MAG: AMP-binding protein, partial [bacterium]|nr:AMP-binding protein [bacterium]